MESCKVDLDPLTVHLAQQFDIEFDGSSNFEPPILPPVPETYGIGLIVGPSGTGKTLLLNRFGIPQPIDWKWNKSIASHFYHAEDAQNRLAGVGLNSIPTWLKPFHVLSTGEKFRANTARRLTNDTVLDEFTSTVDRNVAKSICVAIRRYVDRFQLQRLTIATCHYDVIRWLEPDWFFNTTTSVLDARGRVRRPQIIIHIHRVTRNPWAMFRQHHYLTPRMHPQAQCFLGLWERRPVIFTAVLAFPHPKIKKAFREHRTVVHPDFQGLGIGTRFSDAIAHIYKATGRRYFSRTSHPRMGEYRQKSPLWRPTASNLRRQKQISPDTSIQNHWAIDTKRVCYSHEYIGKPKK